MKISNKELLTKPLGDPFTFSDLLIVVKDHDLFTEEAQQKIKDNYETFDDFLEEINDKICRYFDANFGLTWNIIENHVGDVLERL